MGKRYTLMRVRNPRGEADRKPEVSINPRLETLLGRNIGILDNSKGGGEILLPYLEYAIKSRIPSVELRVWRVPFALPAHIKDPRLREIAEFSDGVIALIGD